MQKPEQPEHNDIDLHESEAKEWSRIVTVMLIAAALAGSLWVFFSPPRERISPEYSAPTVIECPCVCDGKK